MEPKSRLILLAIAGIIIAFAAIAIRNRMAQEPPPAPVVEKAGPRVMIAKRDLAPGTFVHGAQDFDWVGIKPEEIKEGYLLDSAVKLEDFNGAVVRRQMRANEMIANNSLTRSGEGGFMSAVLEPGMRAVSVAVTATSGNAGFIWPGDRVDLIVVRRVRASSNGGGEAVVSETFMRDVRVVAVDQMLDNPDNKAILAKTVTVEVSPRQAEQVSVAAEMGKISLSLRSINTQAKTEEGTEKTEAAEEKEEQVEPSAHAGGITDLYGETPLTPGAGNGNNISSHVRVIRGEQVDTVELY